MSENLLLSPVELYTDGACRGNPGIGGWGALLRSGSRQKELFGYEENTTNNRMELMAAIRGLEAIEVQSQVVLYTDSQYVCKGITEWIGNWKLKGWKNGIRKTCEEFRFVERSRRCLQTAYSRVAVGARAYRKSR